MLVVVLAFAVRPICNDDLWWQLSRGRAVLEGHLAPSSTLLAGDQLREADWLGGVAFFAVYTLTGVFGLMLMKLAAVCGVAVWGWRRAANIPRPLRLLSVTVFTLLVSDACQRTAPLWDVCGLAMAISLTNRLVNRPTRWRFCLWGMLAVSWANLGALSILICLPVLSDWLKSGFRESSHSEPGELECGPSPPPNSSERRRSVAGVLLVGLLGLCLTPRGIWTAWDSLRQLVPMLVESPDILRDTIWRPLWLGPVDAQLLAWAALSLLGMMLLARRIHRGAKYGCEGLAFLLVQSLAWWSRADVVVLSVWLVDWLGDQFNASGVDASADVSTARKGPELRSAVGSALAAALCLTLGGCTWFGIWPLDGERGGLGISRRLNYRPLATSLKSTSAKWDFSAPRGTTTTVHCTDVRTAGMLVWSQTCRSKPYLIPQRALLQGRLGAEVMLNRDLEAGWLKSHVRSDGTTGGWWLPLRSRNALLLVISAEQTALIRSLEQTIWKPLSIDSPVIAYGLAGYPTLTSRIAAVAEERDLRDRGDWTSQAEETGNNQLIDLAGDVTGWPDASAILRRAAVLRAMQRPQGAMRELRPVLIQTGLARYLNHGRWRRELVAAQVDLAEREFLVTGQVGEFRRCVLCTLSAEGAISNLLSPERVVGTEPADANPVWRSAVEQYLAGNPHAAATLLEGDAPAIMSARAMLEWEAGFPERARDLWTTLGRQHPDSRYALVSRYVLESGNY